MGMMIEKILEKKINFLQINLGHRIIAHDALMAWLTMQQHEWVLCIQELYFSNKGVTKIPRDYGAFWYEVSKGKRKRAMVIAPKRFQGYMVTQHSNEDCIIIRIDSLHISVASVYCALDRQAEEFLDCVVKENTIKHKIICCMDANAYHSAWGSDLGKNLKWVGKTRGRDIMHIFDEIDIHICNEPPYPPTFIRDSKSDYSHIDVTACTGFIFNQIGDWKVSNETFGSDHVGITFSYTTTMDRDIAIHNTQLGTPWKKPSQKMRQTMEKVLVKTVQAVKGIKSIDTVDKVITQHSEYIVRVLEKIFRKSRQGKDRVYWWNEEIVESYRQLKIARRRMRRYKHEELRQAFNQKRWEFRRVVNRVKIAAWHQFTTDIRDPWDKLIKIVKVTMSGRIQSRTLCNIHGEYATNMTQTLHLLSKQFFPTPEPLLEEHKAIEKRVNDVLCDECVGPKITTCEFRKAVAELSMHTAPGFDKITNNVITILTTKKRLEREYLHLYNLCLRHSYFPQVWKSAKIVLIPKLAENLDSTKAFRPISLTSSFAKLFERIMLSRLTYYLTCSNAMVPNQHAYNKGRSTQTALYELFNVAQYAMQRRGTCVVVFLDISGAFDRTWHCGILFKLIEYGVPTYLVRWIRSFLSDRKVVFMDGGEEHIEELHQGCPQGGVLSPVLWNVMFNEMLGLPVCTGKKKSDWLRIIGYADDAALICKADTMVEMEGILNRQLEMIRKWAERNRVTFNPQKLALIVLCNKMIAPPAARLFYDGVLINNVQSYKYLGLQVDRRLHWNLHINNVVNKLALVTRSLWGLSRESWGVNLDIYRTLFHSIFLPVLTYGIVIWGWKATSKVLSDKFDREIRKFALMATRCQKSTPSTYLFALLKTQSFSQILINEITKVSLSQLHVTNTKRSMVYENYEKRRITRVIPQCMDQYFYMLRKRAGNCVLEIDFDDINNHCNVHPSKWVQNRVMIQSSIAAQIDSSDMRGWVIFTDASASSYSYGWGFVAYKHGISTSMCNGSLSQCSIFMVEAYAVLQAVRYANTIEGLGKKEIVEIRCDAQGVLRTLQRVVHADVLLNKILEQLRTAFHAGKNVVLRWVPGHQGIYGNEYADLLAKRGVDAKNVTFMPTTIKDIKNVHKKQKLLKNESVWDDFHSNNIKSFLPNMCAVNKFISSSPTVAVCQLVSGHTRLREFVSRVLGLVDSPKCQCGKDKETVAHFLFHCDRYENLRQEVWTDFQPDFEYIARDWEKLKDFVKRSTRFDGRIMQHSGDRGGKRSIAVP